MMKDNSTLISFIIKELERRQDPKRRAMSGGYYPSKQKIIGVTTPDEREVLKKLKTKIKDFSSRQKIDLAIDLVEQNIFECQHIAYELIRREKETRKSLTREDFTKLAKNLDNWVSVDTFSVYIGGFLWQNGILKDGDILQWTQSENRWKRRMSLVCTVGLNQKSHGGKGDPGRTIMICKALASDKDDMVVKALSWALRELSKRDKDIVQEFIEQYQHVLHKKVFREVNNKLTKGTKN